MIVLIDLQYRFHRVFLFSWCLRMFQTRFQFGCFRAAFLDHMRVAIQDEEIRCHCKHDDRVEEEDHLGG